MLLTSLSSMIGAILVPSAYLWLYSTHITLLCLYLIRTKRVLVLFLTLISLFAVWFSETQPKLTQILSEQDRYFINLHQQKLLILTSDASLHEKVVAPALAIKLYLPQSLESHNTRKQASGVDTSDTSHEPVLFHDVQLAYSTHISSDYSEVSLTDYALADRHGAWWLRQLYIDRQLALLELRALDELELPFSLRRNLVNHLDARLQHFTSWRFSKALLLGDDQDWSQRDVWVVRTLGLAHLFVVSGLHAGFMFLIGILIAKAIWRFLPANWLLKGLTKHQVELFCSVPLLVLYGYMTQWGEPVTRAAIMLCLFLVSRSLLMRCSALQILSATLWIVLLINPRSILSPGLWLSFSMVYLLMSFYAITGFKWSRLFASQLMLSTASMVLILGWQEAISITSIGVNLVLIPFAAIIWFPLGLLACVEVVFFSTDYLYAILEFLLKPLWSILESLAFDLPLLFFAESYPLFSKSLLLLAVVFWVLQTPLRRGWFALVAIWCVVFYKEIGWQNDDFIEIANTRDGWFIEQAEQKKALKWLNDFERQLWFYKNEARVQTNKQARVLMVAEDQLEYSAKRLLAIDADWLIVPTKQISQQQDLWAALSINWLDIDLNESLFLYFDGAGLRVKHSRCQYAFFLFKSDTCMRAEKLESVLN